MTPTDFANIDLCQKLSENGLEHNEEYFYLMTEPEIPYYKEYMEDLERCIEGLEWVPAYSIGSLLDTLSKIENNADDRDWNALLKSGKLNTTFSDALAEAVLNILISMKNASA